VKHEQGRFGDTIALGDFFQDVKLILQSKPSKKKKKRHGHDGTSPSKSPKEARDGGPISSDDLLSSSYQNAGSISGAIDEEKGIERTGSSETGASGSAEDVTNSSQNGNEYENEYSFQKSGSVEEDNDESGDEENGILSRNLHGLSEEDRRITRALEKSLGMAADDPDIAEAARRLLDSKVLSADFFQSVQSEDNYLSQSESYLDDEDDDEDDGENAEDEVEDDEDSTYKSIPDEQEQMNEPNSGFEDALSSPIGSTTSQSPAHDDEGLPDASDDDILRKGSNQSDTSFWAFDSSQAHTPSASPPPLPGPNEGTPLLVGKSGNAKQGSSPDGGGVSAEGTEESSTSTPLRSSIFTTVAALAEETGDDYKHTESIT
jgi:hypothetical protein